MRRVTFLVAALAMLLAPLAMIGGGTAMAHAPAGAASMDHCAGMSGATKDKPAAIGIDCLIACAAIPPLAPTLEAHLALPDALPELPRVAVRPGLDPEAATPPPRLS